MLCNPLMKLSLPGQMVYTHFVSLYQSCLENWEKKEKKIFFNTQEI